MVQQSIIILTVLATFLHAVLGCQSHFIPCHVTSRCSHTNSTNESDRPVVNHDHHHHEHSSHEHDNDDHDDKSSLTKYSHANHGDEPCDDENHSFCQEGSCNLFAPQKSVLDMLELVWTGDLFLSLFVIQIPEDSTAGTSNSAFPPHSLTHPLSLRAHLCYQVWLL